MSTSVALDIDQYAINIAKGLIMDTVRKADSGHTGGPLSSMDYTYTLFKEFLKFDPDDPQWKDRDRFKTANLPHCKPTKWRAISDLTLPSEIQKDK